MLRNGPKTSINEGKGWREMNNGETFDAFEVAEVLEPDQAGTVEPVGKTFNDTTNGKLAYVVPVARKDSRKWFFFDPETCLLLKQRQPSSSFYGDAAVDRNYQDYRMLGKAMLPTTVEVVNAGGAGLIVRHVTSRKVNVKTSAEDFEQTTDR